VKTWTDTPAAVNRDLGEGPPRCCSTAVVTGDSLVTWGGLPSAVLDVVRARLPSLPDDPDLYLCAGCRETMFREKLLTREEVARGLGMSAAIIAKTWIHDEEFWRRGPESAPAEVTEQPWWPEYQALVASPQEQLLMGAELEAAEASARGRWKTDVQDLLRRYAEAIKES